MDPDNLVLVQLRELRAHMDTRFDALEKRLSGVESGISGLLEFTAYNNNAIDRQRAALDELRARVKRLEEATP